MSLQFILKVLISALVIAGVSEIAKRSSTLAAFLASLPLTSLLAFVWLYAETGDKAAVGKLSTNIFWLVLPSLPLFLLFPLLMRQGLAFHWALLAACVTTSLLYLLTLYFLSR